MVALFLCPGALLLHTVLLCAHFPWVQQYFVAHAGSGAVGCPVRGPAWGGQTRGVSAPFPPFPPCC